MLLIMNYLQCGVYEQCTGRVKTAEPRTNNSQFWSTSLPDKGERRFTISQFSVCE
jgi:hypothetical protein